MFLEAPQNESADWYAIMTKKSLDAYKGPLDCVVDLGAHIGSFSVQAVEKGAKFALAVEADLRNFDYLLGNIAGNGYEDMIFPIWGAVTGQSFNKVILRAAKTTGQRSLLFAERYDGKPVLTIGLSDVLGLAIRRFGKIDFLKIDIEGSEWAAFQSEDAWKYLKEVRYIDIELHPQQDGAYYDMLKTGQVEEIKSQLSELFDHTDKKSEDWQFHGYNKT